MPTDIFQEWRTADRSASAAERELLKDSLRSIDSGGEALPPEAKARANRLRALANDLFHVAMQEMSDKAASLKRA
jgi:hypothetical protein